MTKSKQADIQSYNEKLKEENKNKDIDNKEDANKIGLANQVVTSQHVKEIDALLLSGKDAYFITKYLKDKYDVNYGSRTLLYYFKYYFKQKYATHSKKQVTALKELEEINFQIRLVKERIKALKDEIKTGDTWKDPITGIVKSIPINKDTRLKLEAMMNSYITTLIRLGEYSSKFHKQNLMIEMKDTVAQDMLLIILDCFMPHIAEDKRSEAIEKFKQAVNRYMEIETVDNDDEKF
jgi:hypothetical protein